MRNGVAWDVWLAPFLPGPIDYVALPFAHPLYILYSSGTTGVPKCIVHTAGGVLLQHLKEHRLHGDVKHGDRMFYFTTCGWMMWNWLVSGLASGATLLLYDGSPFIEQGRVLWKFAALERMTHFGTSAKFIDAQKKIAQVPRKDFDLAPLRVMFSTGSPLSPESFDYVYQCVKEDICLVVDFRGHRHRVVLRARDRRRFRYGAANCSAVAWAWTSTSSTKTGAPVSGTQGRARLQVPVSRDAGRILEGSRTAPNTARRTSSAIRAFGVRATGPS